MKNLADDTMDTSSEKAWFIDNYDRQFDVKYDPEEDNFLMNSPCFAEWSSIAPAFKRTIKSLGFELVKIEQGSGSYSSRMIFARFKVKDLDRK